VHCRCFTEWSACDSLPVDHVGVRGLLPEIGHPVRNLATAPSRTARGSLLANVWCGRLVGSGQSTVSNVVSDWEFTMPLRLGIDIACRAAHQVSLADEQGRFIWTGRRFRTTPQDLARLWAMLPDGTDPAQVLVVMEPTRNAWVPLAAWFRRHGANVVLVPPERSADLRRYYAKHTKSDRLDSQLLARLPMLHPDGLYAE
jgi:hypothetical protein